MEQQRHGFLERLFNEQSKGLRKYFRRRIRKSADIPDLVQEVYLRLLAVKDPKAIRRPVSYLYAVASNLLKDYRQRERRFVNFSDVDEKTANKLLGELASLDGELEEIQILNRLHSVIARMPEHIGTAMTLKYRHGLTYFEIAEAMHISSSSVKKYLATGIAICLAEIS
jgi:RNA polymerase sigma factor (sigma-70 family)